MKYFQYPQISASYFADIILRIDTKLKCIDLQYLKNVRNILKMLLTNFEHGANMKLQNKNGGAPNETGTRN